MLNRTILKTKTKKITILFVFLLYNSIFYGQTTYTSRLGSKFFPGHGDIVITIDSKNIRYEMFNHWYTRSYAELRQMSINLDSLDSFNKNNDTIRIEIHGNKLRLVDKKFHINKNIKHKKLCTSPENMRKISFAYKISSEFENIRHYELYTDNDLDLPEEEFKEKVIENMKNLN